MKMKLTTRKRGLTINTIVFRTLVSLQIVYKFIFSSSFDKGASHSETVTLWMHEVEESMLHRDTSAEMKRERS